MCCPEPAGGAALAAAARDQPCPALQRSARRRRRARLPRRPTSGFSQLVFLSSYFSLERACSLQGIFTFPCAFSHRFQLLCH